MTKWHGGKGSARRKEDKRKIDENWDKIFGKKEERTTVPQQQQDPPDPRIEEQAKDPRHNQW
jgi:hypothetical protein